MRQCCALWHELIEKVACWTFLWRSIAVQRKELITDPRSNPRNWDGGSKKRGGKGKVGIWVNPQNGKVGWELEKGESGYLGEGQAKEKQADLSRDTPKT